MNIQPSSLREFTRQICLSAGSGEAEAAQVAERLVEANLQGHDSHGVGMLPVYIRNIKKGFLQPNAHVAEISRNGNVLLLDGQSGFGQVVGPQAMEMALEVADTDGICIMGLRNAHHLGRIGGLAEQAATAGKISIHYVNVVGHYPLVAPYGGAEGRMNTNPFCCAIPLPDSSEPLIFDMATSTIALGKARVAHNQGIEVSPGNLIDHRGRPTTNPGVMFDEPRGALTYIGAHKGYGLALVCELLAGALVGHWTAQDEHPRPLNVINHMLTIVIDPAVFGDVTPFVSEVKKFIAYIKATEPAEGSPGVMLPGEPERKCRATRLAWGIPMDATTWQQLVDTAVAIGIDEASCQAYLHSQDH